MDELRLMHAFSKHCSLCSEILVHIPFILITFSFFTPTAAPPEFRAQVLPLAQVRPARYYGKAEGQGKPDFKVLVTEMPFMSCLGGRWEDPPDSELNIRKKEKGTFL